MPVEPKLAVELVEISRLFCSPSNPRRNEQAVPHVAASLRRFGFQQPLVAKRSGEIIAGNTRLKAALSLDLKEVPVVWFDGPDLEATAYAIADNRTHEFAEWDDEALALLLQQLNAEDALDGVGYSVDDLSALLATLPHLTGDPELDDVGPQEPPEQPVTRLGDLWILGEHRLLCGDSTKPDDVARLMNGQIARLLATDPPYLVDYDGTNHPAEHHKKGGKRKPADKDSDVGNKHWDAYIDPDQSVAFFAGFLHAALPHVAPDAAIYQWHATRRQSLVEAAWREMGLLVHQTIVWVKTRGVLTRSHFLWKHEPCFYGWVEGNQPDKDRRPPCSETTIWEIGQAGENDGIHPTQKPLEIFTRPIGWHTRPGEVCLEPFSGSGSQLIAAQKLGRSCFAMELSPPFVDAAIQRWQRTTGEQAILESTGETFDTMAEVRKSATAVSEQSAEGQSHG